jgi:hypothetical protein
MGYGGGIGATLGWGGELSAGYFAAPSEWSTFEKEAHKLKKNIITKDDLHGGPYNLQTRRAFVTVTADGSIDRALYDRQMGLWFRQALGASAITAGGNASAGYQTNFFAGNLTGLSLSVQVGRPTSLGVMVATSYNGLKVTKATWGVSASQVGTFVVDTDAWNENVTIGSSGQYGYVAPNWVSSDLLSFKGASMLIGGTATTTSANFTTVSGNAAEIYCKDFTASHALTLDVARYFVGGNGIKSEQIENGMRKIDGTMKLEFANITDVYNAMAADIPKALVFEFVGTSFSTLFTPSVTLTVPVAFFDEDDFHVDGPKLLEQAVTWTAYDDGVNNPFQVTTLSADSTL